MFKCFKICAFSVVFAFLCMISMDGKVLAKPGFDGIDEHGHRVNVVDVATYLKKNPYNPPKAPSKPKPASKKAAPKPKSKTQSVAKSAPKKKRPYSRFDLDDAIGDGVIGILSGSSTTAVFSGGAAAPLGGLVGGCAGFGTNVCKWAWKNKVRIGQDMEEEAAKITEVEDAMGKPFPF